MNLQIVSNEHILVYNFMELKLINFYKNVVQIPFSNSILFWNGIFICYFSTIKPKIKFTKVKMENDTPYI